MKLNQIQTVYSKITGDSPAACDSQSGIIFLHPDYFNALTPFQQKFIYWHEVGHIMLDTRSEIEADAYAFDKLAGTEFRSLKQMLSALKDVLGPRNPTTEPRYKALLIRAFEWDARHGNTKAKEALEKIKGNFNFADGNKLLMDAQARSYSTQLNNSFLTNMRYMDTEFKKFFLLVVAGVILMILVFI